MKCLPRYCGRCKREFIVGPNPLLNTSVEDGRRPGYCIGCTYVMALNEAIARGDIKLEPLEKWAVTEGVPGQVRVPNIYAIQSLDGVLTRHLPPDDESVIHRPETGAVG